MHSKKEKSTEEKIEKEPIAEETKSEKKVEVSPMTELENKVKALANELEIWKNKYYMVYADMENVRKQNDKSLSESIRYRASGFIENLIPALDSFHFALQMKTEDQTVKNFLVGFEHIYRGIKSALESEGVGEIEPALNEKYDYKRMHAIDSEFNEGEENRVLRVMARGYTLKDRIIRPAMVVVSKKKPIEPASEVTKDVPTEETPIASVKEDAKA
jgi:molecular chaperone GrpE